MYDTARLGVRAADMATRGSWAGAVGPAAAEVCGVVGGVMRASFRCSCWVGVWAVSLAADGDVDLYSAGILAPPSGPTTPDRHLTQ